MYLSFRISPNRLYCCADTNGMDGIVAAVVVAVVVPDGVDWKVVFVVDTAAAAADDDDDNGGTNKLYKPLDNAVPNTFIVNAISDGV